ncbi:MAG: AI-2E family transporter [Parcubacteria group bacterium]|jgi:predicted PurR-regulated permease PerM
MQLKNYNVYFFFFVLIAITVVAYFIMQPFLVPFLIAAVLAHLFSPLHGILSKFLKSKGLGSVLVCLLVALIIIVPIFVVLSLVVNEIQDVINRFTTDPEAVKSTINNFSGSLTTLPIFHLFAPEKFINEASIISAVKSLSQNALTILQSAYQGVAHFIFVTFIMFFSLFYLLIDGHRLVKKIMQLSPLADKYENILIAKFNSITRATIKGTILIGIIQGTIGSILFSATGVASPVFFGVIMMISSVIPSIGSGLVWLPVGVVMLLLGHTTEGITILVVGGLVISMIDNLVQPKLVGKDTQMHPLLILFATLGGIALFGFSGFIVGPMLMSLFVALWDIYALEFKGQLDNYNK